MKPPEYVAIVTGTYRKYLDILELYFYSIKKLNMETVENVLAKVKEYKFNFSNLFMNILKKLSLNVKNQEFISGV